MEIRILSSGKEIGPYSESQVRQYLSEGLLSPSDLALGAGLSEWQPLERLLNGLRSPDPTRTNGRIEETPRAITVRATSKLRAKRGPIVLQQPFAGDAPKPIRAAKAALTIEAPRPTTQLPPVAKFIPPEEAKAPPAAEYPDPPAPVSHPEDQAYEPAAPVAAETQAPVEDVSAEEQPQPKPEPFSHLAAADEVEPIRHMVIYAAARDTLFGISTRRHRAAPRRRPRPSPKPQSFRTRPTTFPRGDLPGSQRAIWRAP
jgi:hypothetical protein